jgi:hypothetical protein
LLIFPSSTAGTGRNIHTKNRNRLKADAAGNVVTDYHNHRNLKNISEKEGDIFTYSNNGSDAMDKDEMQ